MPIGDEDVAVAVAEDDEKLKLEKALELMLLPLLDVAALVEAIEALELAKMKSSSKSMFATERGAPVANSIGSGLELADPRCITDEPDEVKRELLLENTAATASVVLASKGDDEKAAREVGHHMFNVSSCCS